MLWTVKIGCSLWEFTKIKSKGERRTVESRTQVERDFDEVRVELSAKGKEEEEKDEGEEEELQVAGEGGGVRCTRGFAGSSPR